MAPPVQITSAIFEAFILCQMKAYLLLTGAPGTATPYQKWQTRLDSEYADLAINHLLSECAEFDVRDGMPSLEDLTKERHNLILNPTIITPTLASHPLALLRARRLSKPQSSLYVPVRCTRSKKSIDIAKLLLAFDALTLSRQTGRCPTSGYIIQGPTFSRTQITLSPYVTKADRIICQIDERQSLSTSPPLKLCRHCEDCAFKAACRKSAIEKDDISLFPSIGEKERQRHNARGIFTVTQLSYTYRARRGRSESGKQLENNSALRALAIRKNITHVIGSPSFEIPPTAVYIEWRGARSRTSTI